MTPYEQGFMDKVARLTPETQGLLQRLLEHLFGKKDTAQAPKLPAVSSGYDQAVAAPVKGAQSLVPPEDGSVAIHAWGHEKDPPPVQKVKEAPPSTGMVSALEEGQKDQKTKAKEQGK